ncbi:MAG: exodeoxyribonuclease V subunit gamma, partial [Deltaproteobacteria bacterium]|nr:exodeoxyribonuclease V subunit gamma [Deltaproteobacteria bacterium]
HWQAVLWRELVQGKPKIHRAALLDAFLGKMEKAEVRFATLPERISVFGISALPPFHLRVLKEISRFLEVNLFLMNPCREYWADIVSGREVIRVMEREKKVESRPEDLHLERGNSLLASMGMLGREFFGLVAELGGEEQELFVDPAPDNLLSCLQGDVLNLADRGRSSPEKTPVMEDDTSLQIHACHSPMREVEILQDFLLGLFASDPGLLPGDILVTTPDIKTYAPFIQAVFSIPPQDPRYIPFSIADRGVRDESLFMDSFLALLDIEGSRFGASQILGLLDSPPVQKKFSLAPTDLEFIHRWVRETNIRWGIDGQSRKELDLPEFPENTWQAGLDRMILGYALPNNGERLFQGTLPYDRIEGSEAEILGNFLGFMDRLFSFVKNLKTLRTLAEWSEFLLLLLDTFFRVDEEAEREIQVARRAIQDLARKESLSGFVEQVGIEIIKAYLRASLDREGFGFGFLTGGVTFCAMLPMRSIPFRVIALLGVNDDAYPRQAQTLGFDLMAQKPRPGDRSRRNDDRYLFLETLLSAREKLYISYIGQSIQDNTPRPPSVLVSELLDTIEQGFQIFGRPILEQVVTRHRLQAFHPEYFLGKGRRVSYSQENYEAAESANLEREPRAPFIAANISPPPSEWRRVEVSQLWRFFANPARFFLNQRLRLYLEDESVIWDEWEPMDLQGLEKYRVEQELAEKGLHKANLRDCFPVIRASGQLPHGTPGEYLFSEACGEVQSFIRRVGPYLEREPRVPLEVDFTLGDFQLAGRIDHLYADGLLHYRCANGRPQDRLQLWICHLVLNRVAGEGHPCQSLLICKDLCCEYSPIEEGEKYLRELLEIYWQGLMRPLPFFPRSSFDYAQSFHKYKDRQKGLAAARRTWEGYDRGEKADPYFEICFKDADPLGEEFCSLAEKIYMPILRCGELKNL